MENGKKYFASLAQNDRNAVQAKACYSGYRGNKKLMIITMRIILGSQSAGRKRMLAEMGLEFEVMSADIDEKAVRRETPAQLVLALAAAKAEALKPRINEPALLITSDQVVVCDGEILEKPEDEAQARSFLSRYGTHPAETVTAVCAVNLATGREASAVDVAKTYFNIFTPEDIDELIAEGELFHMCGGFIIDGTLWEKHIDRIEGARDSVIGLPKELVQRLLAEVGGIKVIARRRQSRNLCREGWGGYGSGIASAPSASRNDSLIINMNSKLMNETKQPDEFRQTADFIYETGIHSHTPRSGFWFLGSGKQSVAEHLFHTAMIAYALCHFEPAADKDKVVRMALFHDIGEGRTADQNYVHQRYGRLAEEEAVRDISESVPFGGEILELFREEQERQTLEARLVKDADNLEWIATLRGEEVKGNVKTREWIEAALKRLKTPAGQRLGELLDRTHPDAWWYEAGDEWFVDRKAEDKKWKNGKAE